MLTGRRRPPRSREPTNGPMPPSSLRAAREQPFKASAGAADSGADMRRLAASVGETLAVVVVAVVFGGLVAAAVPTYLGFQDRKAEKAAESHLLAAVWAAEAYGQDHHGSYTGMDSADLLKIDPRVPQAVAVVSAQRHSYCLTDSVRGRSWSISGPYQGDAIFMSNASCS
jgi:Tfp pilus assembly protein PilE